MAKGKRKRAGSTKKRTTKSRPRAKPKAIAKKKPARLTPAQKAARTRKRNQREAQRKKILRNERARQRRAERELAEQIARDELAREQRGKDERELAIEWAEYMSPVGWGFDLTEPEIAAQKRLPYLVVAKFTPPHGTTYAKLHRVLKVWRDDLVLEAMIHPQRISGIRIVYEDPDAPRGEGDSVVSHAGPWELVISEAAHELDPNDEDSLANRYKRTTVKAVYVYFSAQLARGDSWLPHYQRAA